jgi:hypothetical protein
MPNDSLTTTEIERERESSARLLNRFAAALRSSAPRLQDAAHYVQDRYMRTMADGFGRSVRRRPGLSLAIALMAGIAIGRAFRSR